MKKQKLLNQELIRQSLVNEFEKRAQKNPQFSLRAFSTKVGIDQSLLSKLLAGKRNFSTQNAKVVSEFLGAYLNQFYTDQKVAKVSYESLDEDQFFLISAWHHFAILELIKTRGGPKKDIRHVAERLDISPKLADEAIKRLLRLGFIREEEKRWVLKKASNIWVDLERTNLARKALQMALHQKSVDAINEVPFDRREHSSLTVAVNPRHLPEIKQLISDFRASLDRLIEEKSDPTEVYNLCISFVPLTRLEKRK